MSVSTPVASWETPYINGMALAYATTTTLTVGIGRATNGNFTAGLLPNNIITIEDEVTISTTVVGAGGLDQGTIAASTKYYVYAIGNSNSYAPGINDQMVYDNPYPGSALISTSLTPSLPLSYNMYRYIGSVYTTSGSVFVPFVQYGTDQERTMMYVTAVAELSGGTDATYTNIDVATSVPKVGLRAILKVAVTPTAAADACHILPYGVTSTNGFVTVSGDVAAVVNTVTGQICAAGSNSGVPTLQYKVTGAVTISVQGYIDQL